MAAIYGAELGFDSIELILALLVVQFVGIPFSLIFGRLPRADNPRRPFFLAFIVFNLIALPLVGILGAQLLPQDLTGVLLPDYPTVNDAVGTGVYRADQDVFQQTGDWQTEVIPAAQVGLDRDVTYLTGRGTDARLDFPFNGQEVTVSYSTGVNHGVWNVLLDDTPLLEENDEGALTPVTINAYSQNERYGVVRALSADEPGQHVLSLVNTSQINSVSSEPPVISIEQIEVLTPISQSSLPVILAVVIGVQLAGLLVAYFIGQRLFAGLASRLNTKSSIILALVIYSAIAIWGFVLNSTIEFWFLAWMVAMVQGGSQALSRSLYASMSPASKSGEFFGLFGVMEKFSAFVGPLLFAVAAGVFGSSRPAILALIVFFIVGSYLLTRVNVEEGRRIAQAEDAALLGNRGVL